MDWLRRALTLPKNRNSLADVAPEFVGQLKKDAADFAGALDKLGRELKDAIGRQDATAALALADDVTHLASAAHKFGEDPKDPLKFLRDWWRGVKIRHGWA